MSGAEQAFEPHRDHLMAVAYRMLGTRADAEDAVQEAWLRWHAAADAGGQQVRDPRAWLTTVTARICLDQLRSARVRRESYVGAWLPEPVLDRLPGAGGGSGAGSGLDTDPAERAARTEQVSYALLVVLERLSPEQRVAFVLHDVFAVPFDEVAAVLGTTPGAARQLASRGRQAIAGERAPRHTADLAEQRRVVEAFLAAAQKGDIEGLVAVLAPDVVAVGDGGGVAPAGRRPVVGALPVARFFAGVYRRFGADPARFRMEPVLVNGEVGLYAEVELPDGTRLRGVIAFAVAEGRLTGIFNQANPDKLPSHPVRRS